MSDGLTEIKLDEMEWGIIGINNKLVQPLEKTEYNILLSNSDEFSARIFKELKNALNEDFSDSPDPKNKLDYQAHVLSFLDSSARWLITILHADQVDFYTVDVFRRLEQNSDKKFIFFESGHEFVEAWTKRKPGLPAPIAVLETEHEMGAKSLLEKLSNYLPDGVQRLAVVMLIPAVYPGNLRANVYQRYVGAAVSEESSVKTPWIDSKEIEVFKWHMKEWPKDEKDVETMILQREASILAVMDADAAVFLCGNDMIARGVRSALDKIKSNRACRPLWKAKPILVGFDNSPKNNRYFENSGYTLVTADIKLQFWCADVAKLIHGKLAIPKDNTMLWTPTIEIYR
jgi:hypothetical protein